MSLPIIFSLEALLQLEHRLVPELGKTKRTSCSSGGHAGKHDVLFQDFLFRNKSRIVAWAGQHAVSVRLNLLTAIAKKVEGIERIPEMYAVVPAGPVCAGAWCRPQSAFTAACSPPLWK